MGVLRLFLPWMTCQEPSLRIILKAQDAKALKMTDSQAALTASAPLDRLDHAPVSLARGHIVDQLIEERAPKLAASSLWPMVRPLLYKILDYRKARSMADTIAATQV